MNDIIKGKVEEIEKKIKEDADAMQKFVDNPLSFLGEEGFNPEELKSLELEAQAKAGGCSCFPYFCCGVGCGVHNPNAVGDAHGFG